MPKTTLTSMQREFLSALADVVFGNPFTPERAKLILRLSPGAVLANREALAQVVADRLGDVLRQGAAALEGLPAEDGRLLETALLYVAHHRYVPQIDAHIGQKEGTGARP